MKAEWISIMRPSDMREKTPQKKKYEISYFVLKMESYLSAGYEWDLRPKVYDKHETTTHW